MKNIVLTIALLVATFTIQAQGVQGEESLIKKSKNAKYIIEVNGDCEHCKKRIQKTAYSVSGVKSAVWSAQTHELDLILNEEKATILDVKKAMAKQGHDTDQFKAAIVDYNKLPECCQYERK